MNQPDDSKTEPVRALPWIPPVAEAIAQKIVNPAMPVTANEMGGAILAVLALHKPLPWYEERRPDRCRACTPEGADDDTVTSVRYPCATVLAVAESMGIDPEGGTQ